MAGLEQVLNLLQSLNERLQRLEENQKDSNAKLERLLQHPPGVPGPQALAARAQQAAIPLPASENGHLEQQQAVLGDLVDHDVHEEPHGELPAAEAGREVPPATAPRGRPSRRVQPQVVQHDEGQPQQQEEQQGQQQGRGQPAGQQTYVKEDPGDSWYFFRLPRRQPG